MIEIAHSPISNVIGMLKTRFLVGLLVIDLLSIRRGSQKAV